MFCVLSEESKIESNVKPFVVPVDEGGPTKIELVPLNEFQLCSDDEDN